MSEEIVWGAGMDDADFNRGIKRMMKEIDTLKQKVKDATEESKKQSKETESGMEKAVVSVGKMAMGWVSLQTAIKIATSEYQNYLEVQKEAADETISTADAQIGFLRNLGNVSREQRTKVLADMKAIAKEVNQPVKNLFLAGQSSISAKGILSQQQMLDSLKLAFQVAPESVDEAKSIAGALGDVASLTGHGDPGRNMAFLLAANQQARAETLTQIAKGSLGKAIGIKSFGGDGAEALALTNTFSNVMKDPDGSTSATAAARLASEMHKLKVPGSSTLERIQHLQNNPKAFKSFFDKASFEGGLGVQPAKAVATAGTEAAMLLEQNVAGMRAAGGPGSGAMTQGFIRDIGSVPEQQVASARRAMIAGASSLELGNQQGAMSGSVKENMLKALRHSGQGATMNFLQGIDFHARQMIEGDAPEDAAINILSSRARTVRGLLDPDAPNRAAVDPAQEAIAQKLDAMVASLRGLRADQKQPKKKNVDRNID